MLTSAGSLSGGADVGVIAQPESSLSSISCSMLSVPTSRPLLTTEPRVPTDCSSHPCLSRVKGGAEW
eukprot:1894734-Rhodomonas_salina.1